MPTPTPTPIGTPHYAYGKKGIVRGDIMCPTLHTEFLSWTKNV